MWQYHKLTNRHERTTSPKFLRMETTLTWFDRLIFEIWEYTNENMNFDINEFKYIGRSFIDFVWNQFQKYKVFWDTIDRIMGRWIAKHSQCYNNSPSRLLIHLIVSHKMFLSIDIRFFLFNMYTMQTIAQYRISHMVFTCIIQHFFGITMEIWLRSVNPFFLFVDVDGSRKTSMLWSSIARTLGWMVMWMTFVKVGIFYSNKMITSINLNKSFFIYIKT